MNELSIRSLWPWNVEGNKCRRPEGEVLPDNSYILSKITEVQCSLSKQQQILQQVVWFETLPPYLLCYFSGGQGKFQGDLGAPCSQVYKCVHWWQSCSSDQLQAATLSGTTRNGLWRRNCPCFFSLYGRRCLSKKRGKTLKQKLELDGNAIRCVSPPGHQFKSSLFSGDPKSFPHGPKEMHREDRGCCIQTDKTVWR